MPFMALHRFFIYRNSDSNGDYGMAKHCIRLSLDNTSLRSELRPRIWIARVSLCPTAEHYWWASYFGNEWTIGFKHIRRCMVVRSSCCCASFDTYATDANHSSARWCQSIGCDCGTCIPEFFTHPSSKRNFNHFPRSLSHQ